MPLLKKKDRIRSAKAITSFLDSITDIDSFDVVVSPIDREAFIARGISVRFMPDSYFASINAYNIIFEWPELIQSEYCFLPKTIKEPLINSAAHLAVPFPPCRLANFLTYLQ